MRQSEHWLGSGRLCFYAASIFFAQLLAVLVSVVLRFNVPDLGEGFAFANDFGVFWSASYVGLHGHPVDAYDVDKLLYALKVANPALVEPEPWLHWFYPPTYYLAVLPLAALPFLFSYALFTVGTLVCYSVMLHRIVQERGVWLLVLGFPPVVITAFNGQNAFLTASLAGFGLMLLERRPILAGFCIGLLVVKPHLAILFPLALLCARAWTAMFAAAVTALLFTALSVLVLGVDTVPAFLDSIGVARQLASSGALPLSKMPTVFGSARLLGADLSLANGLHIITAMMGVLAVIFVWCKPLPMYIRGAVLVVASLLVSPHMFDYDLTWLALPIAWIGGHGLEHGWHRGEREFLVFVWLSPLLFGGVAVLFNFQLGPLVYLLLMLYLLHRVGLISAGNRPEMYPGFYKKKGCD